MTVVDGGANFVADIAVDTDVDFGFQFDASAAADTAVDDVAVPIEVVFAAVVLFHTSCKEVSTSETSAFRNRSNGHWFETLKLSDSSANDPLHFLRFHKDRASQMLGNTSGLVPETLKGLWYMKNNPLSDRTLQLHEVERGGLRYRGADFTYKFHRPMIQTWINYDKSHDIHGLMERFGYEYAFYFKDCPRDVIEERRKLGHPNPACKKSDMEYATISPYVRLLGIRFKIWDSLVFFDMYLKPRNGKDYVEWQRRSQIIGQNTRDNLARYTLVQIMDKNGNELSSYREFHKKMETMAAEKNLDIDNFLFYKCGKNSRGCGTNASREAQINNQSSRTLRERLFSTPLLVF